MLMLIQCKICACEYQVPCSIAMISSCYSSPHGVSSVLSVFIGTMAVCLWFHSLHHRCVLVLEGRPYGRRHTRVSNTAMCDTSGGVCSTAADCDGSSSVIHGRCDDGDLGCCIAKDDLCAAKNGTCQANCDATADSHTSHPGCSDGACCVPNPPPFAPCGGPMCPGFRGDRPGQ